MSQLFPIPAGEIIVDNFAGGGGVSTGFEMALGRSPDIALNHNAEALAMHELNHPTTRHLCQNILTADPVEVCGGRPVGAAWFSPDCTHFSKAKGGKPRSKKIRGLAWVMVDWAKKVRPRVMFLENVEEFKSWGPLLKCGTPCPVRKGTTFARFVAALRRLGYVVDWRELRAFQYGAPTLRKRLVLVARCDGRPIVWPEPTHEDPRLGDSEKRRRGEKTAPSKSSSLPVPKSPLLPWRTAAECIDWTIPCPSIFLTREEGRKLGVKRPLVEATMRRIARGIRKFVIEAARPFIVPLTHQGSDRVESCDEPFKTITGAHRGERAVVVPHVTKFRKGSVGSDVREPIGTITAGSHGPDTNPAGASVFGLVEAKLEAAALLRVAHSDESPTGVKRWGEGTHAVDQPIGTIPCSNEFGVLTAHLTEHANASAARNFAADEPLRTQCAAVKGGHFAVVASTLIQTGYGERKGQAPRVPGLDKPLGTVVAGGPKHGVVSAFLAKHFTERKPGDTQGASLEDPMHTVTAQDHHALVAANLMVNNTGHSGGAADAPMPTIPTGGHHSLVTAHVSKLYGTGVGQDMNDPLHTVTGGGGHLAEVRAFLIKYYGNPKTSQAPLDEPMHTATTHDRLGLVVIEGTEYVIVDIGMRMLRPHELFAGQGFPKHYAITPFVNGRPLPAEGQVRMCGNSVPPDMAAAVIGANVPEMAAKSLAA